MSTLSHIFQKPKAVESIGEVYPVLMKDYDKFMDKVNVILLNYAHFNVDDIAKALGIQKEEIKLLDLVILTAIQSDTTELTYNNMCDIFSIVLRKNILYKIIDDSFLFFYSEESNGIIDRNNYDEIRKVIMEQNLLFEPKVYKSAITQQWAEKVLKARAKNSVNITTEDMITTVAVLSGKHYWDLENYSYYQLKAEFDRISKIKDYDTTAIMLGNPYATDIKLGHYAENMNMFKNPYDDVFKEKSEMKKIL